MTSPQSEYSYEQRKHYLEVAQRALENFRNQYPNLRVETWQPETMVATDMQGVLNEIRSQIEEMNAYLEPDEFDGIEIGTYSLEMNAKKRKRIEKNIGKLQSRFRRDMRDLALMYKIELKGLYMSLSEMSAKFTADRIQELHRREEWVKTQLYWYEQYHIDCVTQYSPMTGLDIDYIGYPSMAVEEPGVYFLFVEGEIAYIGSSTNVFNRLRGHKIVQKSYCQDGTGEYKIDCVYTVLPIEEARAVERKMIRMVGPKLNERGRDE